MSVALIAAKAGVSIATVSRVLNNSRFVDPALADSVRRAAEELNLPTRPRRRNKSAAAKRRMTFAVVAVGQTSKGWLEVPVIAAIVGELSRVAQEQNADVQVTDMPDPQHLSPVLTRPGVDGAIALISSRLSMKDLAPLNARMPVVRIMSGQNGPLDFDHIDADNPAIGHLAANYLMSHGLTRLAFLTLRPDWNVCRLRARGFIAAARPAGLTPAVYLVDEQDEIDPQHYSPGAFSDTSLEAAVNRIELAPGERLGLFVPRDEETVNVYRHLQARGLTPGRDVVVVSCDNEQVRLSALDPKPATIDLNPVDIASQAIARLHERIAGYPRGPIRTLVSPSLILGDAPVPPSAE